jgi:hypothetical protein
MSIKLWGTCLPILFPLFAAAQAPEYSGARIAVFEVALMQQKGTSLSLRCRMANTGRQAVGGKKDMTGCVVEFDTMGLPAVLRGHEAAISEAALSNCPSLKPGELSGPVWLNVRLRAAVEPAAFSGCAELAFDTAWVEHWGEREMRLRYVLRNMGSAPAYFFHKKTEPLIKCYFVSGEKLTRGAIPAGSSSIRKGRETLDGVLMPGQSLEASIELPLKDRTRFSPNIALEFDPSQAVDECSRAGNVWVLKLRFGR